MNSGGYAGQFGLELTGGGLFDARLSVGNRDPNFRQLGEQPSYLGQRTIDLVSTVHLDRLFSDSLGLSIPFTITKTSLDASPQFLSRTDIPGDGVAGLRKPRTDLTTTSVSVRRTTPLDAGALFHLGALVNSLSATASYVTGVNQNEYQSGTSRNLTVGLEYAATSDSARTLRLPSWINTPLRWNPTQLRLTSAVVRGSERRSSFLTPVGTPTDAARNTDALARLWRTGSVLEFRPMSALSARWEVESARDLRDYGDSSTVDLVASRERRNFIGANAGFERERTMLTSFEFTPVVSSWVRPRASLATQYLLLRDPNVRSLVPLPGVIGVDSVLATNDSLAAASAFTLPRRLTAAQTAMAGVQFDLGRAVAAYTRDSSLIRRIGSAFAPLDVSYTRSLLSVFDAAAFAPPLSYQLGIGGPDGFRVVSGTPATTAGYTGTTSVVSSVQLPFATVVRGAFRQTSTHNWIQRFETAQPAGQAQVDGEIRVFPDLTAAWTFRPAAAAPTVSSVTASVGYVRSAALVSLPSLVDALSPQLRRTHVETFPLRGSLLWAGSAGFTTSASYALTRQVDTLAGSVSRSHIDDFSADLARAFRVPESWGLGVTSPIRSRLAWAESHRQTFVLDPLGALTSRLQDNGRQTISFSADTPLNDQLTLSLQGSQILTFDRNLNRRLRQTVLSTMVQVQLYGAGK